MAKSNTTPTQVRLRVDTISRIEKIGAMTGRNKTDTIVMAVELLDKVVINHKKGGKLIIKEKDGQEVHLELIGLGLQ